MCMQKGKRYIYIGPLLWEILRFGLLWNMTSRALNVDSSYGTALYLFWLNAPLLGLISGYVLLWLRGGHERGLEIIVIMTKGYQVLIGAAAAVILFGGIGTHPIFFHGESIMVGFLALIDIMILVFLLIITGK